MLPNFLSQIENSKNVNFYEIKLAITPLQKQHYYPLLPLWDPGRLVPVQIAKNAANTGYLVDFNSILPPTVILYQLQASTIRVDPYVSQCVRGFELQAYIKKKTYKGLSLVNLIFF